MKTVLTIAGSDSSGGAGIQADLKTLLANGVYGMSAITALTAQNTTGVFAVSAVSPEFLAQQLDAIFQDIRPDAVKIGLLPSPELVRVIADRLQRYQAPNVVLDPVMVATSGGVLAGPDTVSALRRELFPLAAVITPNLPEAEALSGLPVRCKKDMLAAAAHIAKEHGCAVLCKGGHSASNADDLLYHKGVAHWFHGSRIETSNTHGTGCTLSSAIAANLAKGASLPAAVERAKEYLTGALLAKLDLGAGSGPLDHAYALKSVFLGNFLHR